MLKDLMMFKIITVIKQNYFVLVTPFLTMNLITQCFDTRKRSKKL